MTLEEYGELKKALESVDVVMPIKTYPDDEYSDDNIRELGALMSRRVEQDPTVMSDPAWAEEWDAIQRIAGHRGIAL